MDLPPAVRVLVTATAVAGLVVLAMVLPGNDPVVIGAWFLLGTTTELFRVPTPRGVTFSVAVMAVFTGLLLYGIPVVVASCFGSGLARLVMRPRLPLAKVAFNAGQMVLMGFVAGLAFEAAGAVPGDPAVQVVGPALAATVAYSMVNLCLLVAVLHLNGELDVADLPRLASSILVVQVLYASFAVVGYAAVQATSLLSLLLIFVPMLVARQAEMAASREEETFDRLARTFAKAIEVKDGYTHGHGERVADLSVRIGRELRLSARELRTVRYGALLHDVGKIGVSIGVLCKNGRLTEEEYEEMQIHPPLGAELLRDIDFLDDCLPLVRHHHERPDGRGYPDGLAGEAIPMLTRIVSAADAFDAMTSTRSYRRAMPVHVAIHELHAHTGPQFDADVVAALVRVVERDGWELTEDQVQVVEAAPVAAPPLPVAAD